MEISNCQVVATRVDRRTVQLLDEVSKVRGISRSDLLRLLIKQELARLSLLPRDVTKVLGIIDLANQNMGGEQRDG